jgi:hypothetical protein
MLTFFWWGKLLGNIHFDGGDEEGVVALGWFILR